MDAKNSSYVTPTARLADAIIKSGIAENDTSFLNSDWCDLLREICRLDDEMHCRGVNRYIQHFPHIK